MSYFPTDLRLAVRSLSRSKGMVLVVCASIALAVAGNAAIFSIVEALVLRPIPYPEASRLVFLKQSDRRVPDYDVPVAPGTLLDWRERCRSFSAIEGFRAATFALAGGDHPEEVRAMVMTPGAPALFGVAPARGRGFLAADGEPGGGAVAILTDPLWRRRFGGDPRILGSTIRLDEVPYTVIGILPEDFEVLVKGIDVWVPLVLDRAGEPRDRRVLSVMARLAPGVTFAAAGRELTAVTRRLEAEYPAENRGYTARVRSLREQIPNESDRRLYVLLQTAMLLVLLIACSNVANVQLSRAQGRESEIAVRLALGARRGRIFRELLTESLLLAAGGGALGLLLSAWTVEILRKVMAEQFAKPLLPELNSKVILFSLALALAAGILSGLAPALAASRPEIARLLKLGSRSATASRSRRLLSQGIVVVEIALALTMLTGTGLLVKSILDLNTLDPGFSTENLLTFRLPLPGTRYAEGERAAAFHRQLVERLNALPSVVAATATSVLPRSAGGAEVELAFEGRPDPPGAPPRWASLVVVPPGYFKTLGVPQLAGRDFAALDRPGSVPAAILSQEAVRRYFDGVPPIGRRLVLAGKRRATVQVVGIVGDVVQSRLLDRGGAPPIIYLAYAQQPERTLTYLVRTQGDPLALADAVRATVWGLDRTLPVTDVQTFERHLTRQFRDIGVISILMGIFGLLALILAAVGIYGVLSYSVAQRRHEIGIRMALGADRSRVVKLVMRQGLRLTAFGFLLGAPGVFLAARALLGLVPGAVPVSLATIPVIAASLAVVAAFACFEPANSAASLEPMEALRE